MYHHIHFIREEMQGQKAEVSGRGLKPSTPPHCRLTWLGVRARGFLSQARKYHFKCQALNEKLNKNVPQSCISDSPPPTLSLLPIAGMLSLKVLSEIVPWLPHLANITQLSVNRPLLLPYTTSQPAGRRAGRPDGETHTHTHTRNNMCSPGKDEQWPLC